VDHILATALAAVFIILSGHSWAWTHSGQNACNRQYPDQTIATVQICKQGVFSASGTYQGGIITDGADIRSITWQTIGCMERIEISIHQWAGYGNDLEVVPFDQPCWFLFQSETHPRSLRLSLAGTRGFSAYRDLHSLNETLEDSDLDTFSLSGDDS